MIGGKAQIYAHEDTYLEYTGDTLDFYVKRDGTTVYQGYAERFPDGRPIRIYINRIAQDYLESDGFNPSLTGLQADSGASANFSITTTGGTPLGDVRVMNGWNENLSAHQLLSTPVNGHADRRMYLPASSYHNTNATIQIE